MGDFEKEALADFLEAMSSVKIERDYQADWLDGKLDFYFPQAEIAIVYLNGQSGAVSPEAIEQLKEKGIAVHTFTIAEVCKQAILDRLPSIVDPIKIANNKERLYGIMSRFIKKIMEEINAEEADFSAWNNDGEMKDKDMEQEKRELELEADADIMEEGIEGETDVTENPEPELLEDKEIHEPEAEA